MTRKHTPVSDEHALDTIADLLNGRSWSVEDLEQVAHVVRATGREIADVDDLDFDETREGGEL